MTGKSVDQQLRLGIAAARQGNLDHARRLLLAVIALDEENESAWLWLSGVVESDADRVVCLENVLALNPENQAAKMGLAKLAGSATMDSLSSNSHQTGQQQKRENEIGTERPHAHQSDVARLSQAAGTDNWVIRQELPPVSPAAAVLFPERQVREWRWSIEDQPLAAPVIAYQERSQYDDVWEKEIDICAFCAAPVAYDATNCSHCRRKLTRSHFRYPNASADSMVYLVLVLGVGQLYFIRALIDIISQLPLFVAVWHGLLFLVLFAFAVGVYFRQVWAYYGSLVFLIMAVGVMLVDMLSGSALSGAAETATGVDFFLAMAENPLLQLLEPILRFLPSFQLIGMILALLYGILRVYPDFAREQVRLLASVDKSLADASQFYTVGKGCARNGMWASAVLCWQRAAAQDPTRSYYQQILAEAYALLGFYERSLDNYRSAARLTSNAETRQQLELAMATVEQKLLSPV